MKLHLRSILLICLVGLPQVLGAQPGKSFSECEKGFRLNPEDPATTTCFYLAAQADSDWQEAERRLNALKLEYPDNSWLELTLGHLDLVQGKPTAERHYRDAADGFASSKNPSGEVLALTNLRNYLQRDGQVEEASLAVERAARVAEESKEPVVVARAGVLKATHVLETGGDLGEALLSVRLAVTAAFPDGSYGLKRQCLLALGRICTRLGRYQEARSAYQRLSGIMREAGDLFEEPTVIANRANLWLRELEEVGDASKLPDVTALASEALEKAVKTGNGSAETLARRLLAEILGADPDRKPEVMQHLEACFSAARSFKSEQGLINCLWTGSQIFSESDPAQARDWLERAIHLAMETNNSQDLAYAWQAKMRVSWKENPPREALADSLRALSAIEALRDLQNDETVSVGVFSQWARDYQWLVGRLLGSGSEEDRWAVAQAFTVSERMRARFLLDRLASSRLPARLPPDHPLSRQRSDINGQMVALQKRLLSPDLDGPDRKAALKELDRLEALYEETLSRLRASDPDQVLREPMFADLGQVERQLKPNEALLSFQVAQWRDVLGRFAGGAWLFLTTRQGTRVFRLPDRKRLRPAVTVFLGLLARRDGQEARAAAEIHHDLLAEALASLPPQVDHLILVPDGALHHLPFGALRPQANAPPLAKSFELSIVPSATLWSHWRGQDPQLHAKPALALADPELPYMTTRKAIQRGWPIATGVRLGPLPFARREGHAVRRILGNAAFLRVGREASEEFIKGSDLGGYAVLHLAAHAVVDEETPARSAVLLAPGDERQDGLWQVREIVESKLTGQLVVLSACRTASGAVLSGEGVVGLARAFFQAGADTVVGSLWPLRDDEAAWFFERFYRHLARGESVAGAIRSTQSEAIEKGMPAASWSGLVTLGNGGLVPFPGGVPSANHPLTAWIALLAAAALALFVWRRSSRLAE